MKRRIAKIAFALALFVLLLEGICSGWAWLQYRTLNVARLNELDTGNTYVTDQPASYVATLMPDPYLGNRHNSNLRNVNNVGLRGPDFPLRKDESKFTVLLTGGSVAAQLGETGELDRALNNLKLFDKPVLVLDGAGGGWHQPRQAIMVLLYGELADAIITLDGFNEMRCFRQELRHRLELDGGNFYLINPAINGGFDRLGAAWQTNKLRQLSLASHSRAVYFATRAIRNGIEASIDLPPDDFSPAHVYSVPKTWTVEERREFNLAQYTKYIKSIDALAAMHGTKVAHFLQPCPAFSKVLTDEEKRVVGELEYAEAYQWVHDRLVKEGAISLFDCYADTTETIYNDRVHCKLQGPGYRIMAERIAAELSQLWAKEPPKQP